MRLIQKTYHRNEVLKYAVASLQVFS